MVWIDLCNITRKINVSKIILLWEVRYVSLYLGIHIGKHLVLTPCINKVKQIFLDVIAWIFSLNSNSTSKWRCYFRFCFGSVDVTEGPCCTEESWT